MSLTAFENKSVLAHSLDKQAENGTSIKTNTTHVTVLSGQMIKTFLTVIITGKK